MGPQSSEINVAEPVSCQMHGKRHGDPVATGVVCNGRSANCDVIVSTGEVQLRTCKLTKSILKQMPEPTDLNEFIRDTRDRQDCFVGWMHGSVLGDDHVRWLIYKNLAGEYRRWNSSPNSERIKKTVQLYVI